MHHMRPLPKTLRLNIGLEEKRAFITHALESLALHQRNALRDDVARLTRTGKD
jgi:hypothetical protein